MLTTDRRRLVVRGMIMVLAAGLVSACSVFGPGRLPEEPALADPLPPDQIVFEVSYGGGPVAAETYATMAPTLLFYGDGRVIALDEDDQRRVAGAHRAYRQTKIDPALVAGLVEQALSAGLGKELDFGMTRVPDAGAVRVLLHGADDPVRQTADGFSPDLERRLDPWQKQRRELLRSLIDNAGSLTGDAPWTPYRPGVIFVYEQEQQQWDQSTPAPWPGPAPKSFLGDFGSFRGEACGELRGATADMVYRASLQNRMGLWIVDGKPRKLLINPVPGSRTACDR